MCSELPVRLQGREPGGLEEFNNQLRQWVWAVANQRVHRTTHQHVMAHRDAGDPMD